MLIDLVSFPFFNANSISPEAQGIVIRLKIKTEVLIKNDSTCALIHTSQSAQPPLPLACNKTLYTLHKL